jgi:5'-3' exonuclease
MSRTLLVDADIVAYKFSAATEQVFFFDGKDAAPCVDSDLGAALVATDEYLDALADDLKATQIIVCLTDDANFRHTVWPNYKGNRKGLRKPENLAAVKEHFSAKYKTYQRPGLEADDCMGILATHPTLVPGERIIVSEDKDMQTIPGLLFNPAKDSKPRKITRLDADRFHLWQTICGDQSDGYPGAKGVGPKSPEALAVLESQSVAEAWQHVKAAYARVGLTEADAVTQARLARILRATDWDFQRKLPRLWIPPRIAS